MLQGYTVTIYNETNGITDAMKICVYDYQLYILIKRKSKNKSLGINIISANKYIENETKIIFKTCNNWPIRVYSVYIIDPIICYWFIALIFDSYP